MFSLLKSVREDPTNFCAARRGLVLVAMVVLRRIYGLVFPVGMSANPKGKRAACQKWHSLGTFCFSYASNGNSGACVCTKFQ